MPLTVSIVTAERTVVERDDVLRLIVPTSEGQITVLPLHAALMASLQIGEMVVQTTDGVSYIAVHGGFIQVANDVVTVLADAAEHVDDIDEARAEEARTRAEQRLAGTEPGTEALDNLRAQLALQRALLRLRVRRNRHGTGVPSMRDRV